MSILLEDEKIKEQTHAPVVLSGHRRAIKAQALHLLNELEKPCKHGDMVRGECVLCLKEVRAEIEND